MRNALPRRMPATVALLLTLLIIAGRAPTSAAPPRQSSGSTGDLFGMVMRDPYYEYGPATGPNMAALERQAAELQNMGVRWVRLEFFADGDINWARYDAFINEIAPRYRLKILGLLNAGIVSYQGASVDPSRFNDPPDQNNGSNHFIRVFRDRAREIAEHYGSAISAYEVINEPNINLELWNSTGHKTAEIRPDRYATLISQTYQNIKAVTPDAQVIIGGMLLGPPPKDKTHDELDWLYQLYEAQAVKDYQASGDGTRPGWNVVPWDGVGLHPYRVDANIFAGLARTMAQKIRDRGDSHSQIWVTEVGVEAWTNPPDQPPSEQEQQQAAFLEAIYHTVLDNPDMQAAVHSIFWFKYEDFPAPNPSIAYGLVRLRETPSRYDPSGAVLVHKLGYRAYQAMARPGGLPERPTLRASFADGSTYFEQTGQSVAPEFQEYWQSKGGVAQFGYPLTQLSLVRGYMTQFFERAVFEYHPENAPPYDVLLRRLGAESLPTTYPDAAPTADTPTLRYFPQTRHTLGGRFLDYWARTGGLAVYGYPLSEEVQEANPRTRLTYTVQYFERNRFEYHPENAGTPYEIELGLLGGDLLLKGLWWR